MGNGTPIGRVRGLGSAHSGAHHWWLERISGAFVLIPTVFLLVSILLLPDLQYATVREWIAGPLPAIALAAFLLGTLWHNRLGLRVFIEDYAHVPSNRIAIMLLLDIVTYAAAFFTIYCLVRLVLSTGAA
ncbi:succinate dehydrogenase, hydrophobic membrane anchor protein [Altererythrobacter aerius]|uniref:Succinate dehydrogenase hydrophobic membrane anchor subunit n=1 Tax=Tsuneonella aeria TaxID=1837929 RepID=A0A6I4TBG4_9SPHN|nr:succinate dehydrogenase, hydrophobic membrane anchor protein [Tsuneonella aeria]MXO73738.1 succinate dehydrogenase, hydrophobic membrane anchor protein [Tsuneonella aeria]